MESKAYNSHRKRRKRRNRTQIRATSMQEPVLTTNPSLPQELITEILLRLPVKPLLQFRSVSKSWLALISSPQFVKAHVSLCASNKDYTHHKLMLMDWDGFSEWCILKDCSLRSLLYGSVIEASDLNQLLEKQTRSFLVVGSINGLICVANEAKDLFLLNPSIRAHKKLPDFRSKCKDTIVYHFIYGFGYDECNDDYKVVVCMNRSPQVQVYSLKSDSWRSIRYPEERVKFHGPCKLVNGKLHWANNVTDDWNEGWNIISFDLAEEKWEKVEHPRYGEEEGDLVLGVLGNNLSVLCNGNLLRTDLDVWVMKEYGVEESWTKIFTFKYPDVPTTLLDHPPFLVSKKGEISLMFGQNLFLYNPNDESITYRRISRDGFVAAIFLESLVSPLLHKDTTRMKGAEAQMDAVV